MMMAAFIFLNEEEASCYVSLGSKVKTLFQLVFFLKFCGF